MTRRLLAAGMLVLAAVLVGLGIFFANTDLDRGDQLASVLGLFLNVVGAAAGIIGAVVGWLAWRDSRSPVTSSMPAPDATGTSSIRIGTLRAGRDVSIAGGDQSFGGGHRRTDATRRSDR